MYYGVGYNDSIVYSWDVCATFYCLWTLYYVYSSFVMGFDVGDDKVFEMNNVKFI